MAEENPIGSWKDYNLCDSLTESLTANNFLKPTEVQGRSLVYLNSHVDMIIAAQTGKGKTLCFGIPMLDLLLRRIEKVGHEEEEFDTIKSLIMSPTRELAMQIKDMIEAIIPA
jgi:superfamily II DNA/RNA helicase